MSAKRSFILSHPEARRRAIAAVAEAPEGWAVTVGEPTRNLDQNAAMWPILDAFSKQLQWPVNGAMCWITPEEYKDILTAAFRKENARLAQGWDGGVVMLGASTSKMTKAEFSDWLEFLHMAAAVKGVDISQR